MHPPSHLDFHTHVSPGADLPVRYMTDTFGRAFPQAGPPSADVVFGIVRPPRRGPWPDWTVSARHENPRAQFHDHDTLAAMESGHGDLLRSPSNPVTLRDHGLVGASLRW